MDSTIVNEEYHGQCHNKKGAMDGAKEKNIMDDIIENKEYHGRCQRKRYHG